MFEREKRGEKKRKEKRLSKRKRKKKDKREEKGEKINIATVPFLNRRVLYHVAKRIGFWQ